MTATEINYVVKVPALLLLILARLGLTGSKIPADAEGKFEVELPRRWTTTGEVVPGGPYTVKVTKGESRRRPHRMHVLCKHCQRHIPAGRLAQHMKIHN